MPKDSPSKAPLNLHQIARDLRRLADDLESGHVRIGSSHIPVGHPTFFKTKNELKSKSAYITLAIKMPLAHAAGDTQSDQKDTARPDPEPRPPRVTPRKPGTQGSGEGKRIKKEIGRLWKSLVRHIGTKEQLPAADSSSLLKLCEDYNLFSQREWAEEWRLCCRKVEECLRAAAQERWPEAEQLATEVNRLLKACHKKYK